MTRTAQHLIQRAVHKRFMAKSAHQPQYLSNDLFVAAFDSEPSSEKPAVAKKSRAPRKLRKRPVSEREVVIGGRTIRKLGKLSDPQNQATTRTLPSKQAEGFIVRSLDIGGKATTSKVKRRGWERRPAHLGAMKPDGAPVGFVRGSG